MSAHQKQFKWKEQRAENDKLMRSAVPITLKQYQSIELSNGVTVAYTKPKSGKRAQIIIVAPRDVKIYRQLEEESDDGEAKT